MALDEMGERRGGMILYATRSDLVDPSELRRSRGLTAPPPVEVRPMPSLPRPLRACPIMLRSGRSLTIRCPYLSPHHLRHTTV
jgi:hypothetical protein